MALLEIIIVLFEKHSKTINLFKEISSYKLELI